MMGFEHPPGFGYGVAMKGGFGGNYARKRAQLQLRAKVEASGAAGATHGGDLPGTA